MFLQRLPRDFGNEELIPISLVIISFIVSSSSLQQIHSMASTFC